MPGTLLGPEGTGRLLVAHALLAGRSPHGPLLVDEPLSAPSGGGGRRDVVERVRPLLENCTVDASIFSICGQVFKGTRWMPWHQEPMKDVGACDKPRVVGNRTLIRGFPNGETRLESCPVTRT